MNEVSAAMGITSLEDFETFIELNRSNYQTYVRELTGIRGLRPVMYDEQERNNYHYVVLETDEAVTGVSRDQLVDILRTENVLARRYFYPGCHNMEPYRSYFPLSQLWLPETERMAKRVLVLPTGAAVTTESIKLIGQIIRMVVSSGREIRDRLKQPVPALQPGLSRTRTTNCLQNWKSYHGERTAGSNAPSVLRNVRWCHIAERIFTSDSFRIAAFCSRRPISCSHKSKRGYVVPSLVGGRSCELLCQSGSDCNMHSG